MIMKKLPKFTCTCPDFLGKRLPNPASNYPSDFNTASWNGAQERKSYCWHIISTIINTGLSEDFGIPTDLPIPNESGMKKDTRPKMQKDKRKGDYFGI
jgi:hypothetical protein